MSKAGMVAIAGVLVAACVGTWVIWPALADSPDALAISQLDAEAVAIDAPVAAEVSLISGIVVDRTETQPVAPKPALPPLNWPFHQAVEALEVAAGEGDPVAACRLAAEALRCSSARQMVHLYVDEDRQIKQMAAGNLDAERLERRIKDWVERREINESIVESCEGVDVSIPQRIHYDALASAAGDPTARMRYLSGMYLQGGPLLRHPELLDHYKTHAYGYFMQALEAGDLGILALWLNSARFEDETPLTFVLPEQWRDPGFVSALITQLTDTQRLATHTPDFLITDSSPQQQAEAARIFAQYFAAAEPPNQRARSLGEWELDPAHCEDLSH